MNKFLILAVAVAFIACSRKQEGYKIKVSLEGADGQVLLEKRGTSRWIPVDTADIVDGKAVLTGKVSVPEDYYLSVMGQRAKAIVFVENKEINVTGHIDSLDKVIVKGSVTHDEYESVNRQIMQIRETYMGLYEEARRSAAAGDTARVGQLMEQLESLNKSPNTLQADFVRNNPQSFVSPFLLLRIQHVMEVDELDELVESLDPALDSVETVLMLKDRVMKLKTVSIGQTAPDFIMNDPGGNPIRFSDVYARHEYTLLDFWAAWCGPCRVENPNIVAIYNDYKDKGFSVFGVSLDRDREAWLKAIEDDRLTWTHVSDLSYWNNAAAQMYLINSIPSSLIVDKNGKIIAKNKREDELRKTVAELLQ